MTSTILNSEHIRKAISDNKFFEQMPEFASLKAKMNTMKVSSKGGCSPCKERRIRSSVHGDFVSVLNGLSTAAMERFKKYLGVDTLLINAFERSTGNTVLKKY